MPGAGLQSHGSTLINPNGLISVGANGAGPASSRSSQFGVRGSIGSVQNRASFPVL